MSSSPGAHSIRFRQQQQQRESCQIDPNSLEHDPPQINVEFFHEGNFVVHEYGRKFSALAIDQAHGQSNALIKGDGGAMGITENSSTLRRWMVAGPEVTHMVSQYEHLHG